MSKLIWGAPIRLFHWSLFGLLCVSIYTGKFGDFDSIDNHMLAGYGVIALVLFRVLFGLFGKGYVRFTKFVKGPGEVVRYARDPTSTAGHNPLGALAIVALLLSLAVQTGTGMFTSDEIFVEGPLFHLVDASTSSLLAQIHGINFWILTGLISLHLIAVLVHQFVLKHSLIIPMITGKKTVSDDTMEASHQIMLATGCFIIAAGITWYVVNKL